MSSSKGTIRWGILGTGNIATQFAQGLAYLNDAKLMAVGSRDMERAQAFGKRFGAPRIYSSYEQVAQDCDVDVVYIATPNHLHAPNTLMCLDNGKAVLCEKPFALCANEAEQMITQARRQGQFLMEALWTHFLPSMTLLRSLLAQGRIGEIQRIVADLGIKACQGPEGRLFNPAMGGGALLDLGVYLVSLSLRLLGEPSECEAVVDIGATGVDERCDIRLGWPSGAYANLTCTLHEETAKEMLIIGTQGNLRVHGPLWRPERLSLEGPGINPTTLPTPYIGNGYHYEAEEVGLCLKEGLLESGTLRLEESLATMRVIDTIRASWQPTPTAKPPCSGDGEEEV